MKDPITAFPFQVKRSKKTFQLFGTESLPPKQIAYLESYLNKISRYPLAGKFGPHPVLSLYQSPLTTAAGTRSLAMRLQRRFHKQRIPATATLAINRACQCACEHCSAYFHNRSTKEELTKQEWQRAIAESIALGVNHLIFLGGEPLLRKDLPELISFASTQQTTTALFTNGEFLTEETCEKLAQAGLMGAFISLDSIIPSEHDRLRRRSGLFVKALQGIHNLQKAGILTALSTYLNPRRLQEGVFEAMMELGKKLSVNEVTFFDAIPSGRWLKNSECTLQAKDRKRIQELVRTYRHQSKYPVISAQSTLTCEGGSAFCFAANTQFYLSAHGEMQPCDFTPWTFGRFPEESLSTLWDRMTHTPPYHHRAKSCRMQDPAFRKEHLFAYS